LVQFRIAGLRVRIIVNEIEAMMVALNATAEAALVHLHETGAAGLIPTSSAIAE
jgi:hypothetical protein